MLVVEFADQTRAVLRDDIAPAIVGRCTRRHSDWAAASRDDAADLLK